jgi:drug/metabolite transporter (DMT)-like permease
MASCSTWLSGQPARSNSFRRIVLALLAASLIWSFSFGVIKAELAGLPTAWVAFCRMALAAVAFLPVLRLKPGPMAWRLCGIGGLQFGLMYLFYLRAFQDLAAYEVALFTIFTPVWVLLLSPRFPSRQPLKQGWTTWFAVLCAVLGAGLILYQHQQPLRLGAGFLWMQAANFCFAWGQLLYRRWRKSNASTLSDAACFAWMYLGAAGVTLVAVLFQVNVHPLKLTGSQLLAVMYLGIVASGLGFYFWNLGASRVSISRLAVANNLKVPLAVLVSLLFFQEPANLVRLGIGASLLVLGLSMHRRPPQGPPSPDPRLSS